MAAPSAENFVASHAALGPVPFVPRIRLYLAQDAISLWEATERAAGRPGLPPPFWAFPWPGGLALARYLLDHPEAAAGRRVLDTGSGSGVTAIAAALAGARAVLASELDPLAAAAIELNARANGVTVTVTGDVLDGDGEGADLVLAGDVWYERALAGRALGLLRRAAARGATVLVGDTGRAFLPRAELRELAAYQIPVVANLEDAAVKRTAVLTLPALGAHRTRPHAGMADCDGGAGFSREGAVVTELRTDALEVPGAVLHYDVRANDASTEPVLLIAGSPMCAASFATLAGHFTDRTVVTFDPRGAGRSKRTDGAPRTTTAEHVDDLHRLIAALDAGPVDIFGSSGGAVNALALVAAHPEQVRVLVAHEPPAAAVLPDREQALAACDAIAETYQRHGFGPAMARFIAMVSHEGPFPPGYAGQPGPDPASFELPTEDDGARDDPLLGLNMPATSAHEHDFDALRAAPTRIVIGIGTQSANQIAGRAARAVAERLGIVPVTFPGGHDGFRGGEHDRTGQPAAFAATLRAILAG